MSIERWETRRRGNAPKHIDIMAVGAANSSGAVARVPIRDGFGGTNERHATLIAAAPDMLRALKTILALDHGAKIGEIAALTIYRAEPGVDA